MSIQHSVVHIARQLPAGLYSASSPVNTGLWLNYANKAHDPVMSLRQSTRPAFLVALDILPVQQIDGLLGITLAETGLFVAIDRDNLAVEYVIDAPRHVAFPAHVETISNHSHSSDDQINGIGITNGRRFRSTNWHYASERTVRA
ncbi:hypothetical protein [Brucella intermedia]|uniref:hypothetical protein n=1 Tax=Brucella intermedia TaxID=94625 RepID=UPI0012DA6E92|nr:hypothetical protein [Brucella intermedia]